VADIRAQMELDSRQFNASLRKAQRNVEGFGGVTTKVFAGLAVAFAAIKISDFGRNIVNVAGSFEQLRVALETVTGSAKNAQVAFDAIQNFADRTPFEVDELTDAFTKLAAYGLNPSIDTLKSLGNTASALGKPLNQAVEALADAATGEFERLKEFGIKASREGDRVKFTFRGITTEIGNNAAEIQQYLLDIGNTEFAGAIEKQSTTLNGLLSTLSSNFKSQAVLILESTGAYDGLKNAINGTIGFVKNLALSFGNLLTSIAPVLDFLNDMGAVFYRVAKGLFDLTLGVGEFAGKFIPDLNKAVLDATILFYKWATGIAYLTDKLTGGNTADEVYKIVQGLERMRSEGLGVTEVLSKVPTVLEDIVDNGNPVTEWAEKYNKRIQENIENTKSATQELEKMTSAQQKSAESTKQLAEQMKAMDETLDEIDKEFVQLNQDYEKWNANVEATLDSLLPTRKATKDFYKDLMVLDQALKAGKISWEEYADAQLALQERIEGTSENTEKVVDEIYSVQDALKELDEAGKDVFSGFTKTVREGGNAFDFLSGKAEQTFNKIVDSFIDSQIQNLFNQAIGGFGGGGGGLGSLFAGFFANGGMIPAGKYGIVGEKGPEVVTGPANITPMDKVPMNSGATTVTNTFNIYDATDPDKVAQAVAQRVRTINNMLGKDRSNRSGA